MRSQKRLRDDLRFVTEFNTLFDVVQQVAVSQLRHLEELLAAHSPLADVVRREFLPLLPPDAAAHPLLRAGAGARLVVLVTSDEGMVGPLHTAAAREAIERAGTETRWLLIGQRGLRLLGLNPNPNQARVIPVPPEERVTEQMQRVADYILLEYGRGVLRDVWLVAPTFVSATRQDVAAHQLLPLPVPDAPAGAAPAGAAVPGESRSVLAEPSLSRVVEQTARCWVETVCLEAFWSARRAEFAARALHVEASRQELNRRSKTVRHEFFKSVHERVDKLVRETCVVQRQVARRARRPASAGMGG
jgi:F0F1-type ATP synthase gamma subunit